MPLRRRSKAGTAGDRAKWWPRVVAAVLLLGACQSSPSTTSEAPLPPGPPVVTVVLREYTFDYNPSVPSGRVVFRLVNAGRLTHQPGLRVLPDEMPPIGEHFRNRAQGGQPAVVSPYAGVPPRDPGETGTFAVDLQPGQRYAFICFARDADDDEPHAYQGMATEFLASGGSGAPPEGGPPAAPDLPQGEPEPEAQPEPG